MQKQFLQMVMKQKNLHLDNQQYQQINNYLQQLQLAEEKELDEKKSFLYMNQSSQKFVPQNQKKIDEIQLLGQGPVIIDKSSN